MFYGTHFGDQVGEVREGQQAAAGEHELRGGGLYRNQFLDIPSRPKAAVVLPLPSPV